MKTVGSIDCFFVFWPASPKMSPYTVETERTLGQNNYLPKCWKVLFFKPRFIEIFFSSSEARASAEIVRDESRFGNRTF